VIQKAIKPQAAEGLLDVEREAFPAASMNWSLWKGFMTSLLFHLQEEKAEKKGKSKRKRINEPSHIVPFPLLKKRKKPG
jgi:hypothetical protein